MRFFKTKWGLTLLAAFVVAGVAATVGFAYFSSTGTGTGTASVGSSTPVQITSTDPGPLYPGVGPVTLYFSIYNPGGGDEYVNQVTGTVANLSNTCMADGNFTIAPFTYGGYIAGGATVHESTTITMNETGAKQDCWEGATLHINWASN